ncbi:MAG TPA: PaaI family thioesterase [Candidatus Angelobacter sp.]|nr:PaaI family thioesterase [Candidatus Angelobacter sp.]
MARSKPAHGHEVSEKPKRRKNHCFACGKDNSHGMRLKFFLDEQTRLATCRFKLSRRYQGPPGHAHGGIIATILDEAMGKVNRLHNVIALTRAMHVDYLKPVPLGKTLLVTGREQSVNGREHVNVAEISDDDGQVLARSSGTFLAIEPARLFAKFRR